MLSFKTPRHPVHLSFDVGSDEKIPIPPPRRPPMLRRPPAAMKTDEGRPRPLSCDVTTLSTPVLIPSRSSSRSSRPSTGRTSRKQDQTVKPQRPLDNAHKPDAMAPGVAALLALTSIPPRKNRREKPRIRSRRISIEELVQEWRAESLSTSNGFSHKSMEMLLEPCEVACADSFDSSLDGFPMTRVLSDSSSNGSTPSLDADDRSLLSIGNPPTPESLRVLESGSTGSGRKLKPRALTCTEDCAFDHPLIPRSVPEIVLPDESFAAQPAKSAASRKSSFKSNLTSSLQSLKSRALNSLSQFSLNNVGPNPSYNPYAFSDATLWQHPFIFPRVGPEIRPNAFDGTPTKSQRRYFNPTVLSFDEQQSRFRKALHSYQPEHDRQSPMIQMKTYTRPPTKRSSNRKSTQDLQSEAANSPAAPSTHSRPREVRENSDFLRVVVLEMNMRRVGKLDESATGRARIWLPPRQASAYSADDADRMALTGASSPAGRKAIRVTPTRWKSVSVYE